MNRHFSCWQDEQVWTVFNNQAQARKKISKKFLIKAVLTTGHLEMTLKHRIQLDKIQLFCRKKESKRIAILKILTNLSISHSI